MKKVYLEAEKRELLGKKVSGLRKNGVIPAIVYGHGMESFPISVPIKSFVKIIGGDVGKNAIIDLKIKNDTLPVLVHDVQRDVLGEDILHIDFFRIRMDEKIKTKVHVELTGESIGVKDEGGILVHNIRELEVECLPDRIPEKFEFDVSLLNIGDSILVSDIEVKEGVKILANQTDSIVHISAPAKEEVVAAPVVEGALPAEGEGLSSQTEAKSTEGATSKEGDKSSTSEKPKK
ncbi:hypothetical protein A2526_04610 [candidate division WOR-1 bacterium RIFOXYD2_FULL_36_8]|uniref:Large ribosomal subunit protein bL25 n=1 Tax=candidate division WOR-1 bacterium RIFOXYB2_FULL_36_35 TaxID=1802578 RepID=A0A1F4S7F3_UNCSA|nr:MAG: hypothetical protein A2230_01735 [candidate division WOR-1 bacterium RIFOXYA2_FULL_36_21]OGC15671.1 MAG: hypothetical protein A2282_04310 [candidate division WOR-1 bacterium RIFOXYA12_FULL_36_13]OGC16331.1 MAG: hypothetical protein A2290_04460 [candidate division WOR-1 bacterium RIFOXYB2_FULL_36_35]OGC39090.1 MAG: hypothetical protein A2526_04610 [candidate division WOR-1 bacterium RIFOXYD2_FULL_36_8]